MANHLANETSPYLLQHVNNPVDWYPWGDEALARSRKMDLPIFLSIGYSACHWCHVMEHESFENPDVANLMNQWFVCIKVDREERPDLDHIYMSAVQAMTGSGGWPMSMFLTPTLQPFYGGTYWPPTSRWGRPGFREILAGVHDAWINRREAVDSQADELTQHLQHLASSSVPPSPLGDQTLQRAMNALTRSADRVHGGFGSAPKFPQPMNLRLGMRCWKRYRDDPDTTHLSKDVLEVVTLTLDKMARGGIYDHLGGGFARYSTDERWLVPHFEKMLYDNAQLVPAYLEAFQITGRADFANVARETLDYLLREMTDPDGGFFSTQDADSEEVEGKFFVWSEQEVDSILGQPAGDAPSIPSGSPTSTANDPRALRAFKFCYDVTAQGNWELSNILNRLKTTDEAARAFSIDPIVLESMLANARQKLFEVRSQRIWPGRDEKILTSWNGLMIGAMSIAANVLKAPEYARAACRAADFILNHVVELPVDDASSVASPASSVAPSHPDWPQIRLLHSYKDGRARFNAYLDDYAAMIDGLCELYQAVFETKYLDAALSLAERMIDQFWDDAEGGFFYTSNDHESLIARVKDVQDNATPSGNSLAALGLLKLARLTGRTEFEQAAIKTLEMASGVLERAPLAAGVSLMAFDFLLGPTHEIVLVRGGDDEGETSERGNSSTVDDAMRSRFLPNKVIHRRTTGLSDDDLSASVGEILKGKHSLGGEITAYFCQHGVCGAPVVGEQAIKGMLEKLE